MKLYKKNTSEVLFDALMDKKKKTDEKPLRIFIKGLRSGFLCLIDTRKLLEIEEE